MPTLIAPIGLVVFTNVNGLRSAVDGALILGLIERAKTVGAGTEVTLLLCNFDGSHRSGELASDNFDSIVFQKRELEAKAASLLYGTPVNHDSSVTKVNDVKPVEPPVVLPVPAPDVLPVPVPPEEGLHASDVFPVPVPPEESLHALDVVPVPTSPEEDMHAMELATRPEVVS